MKKLSRHFIPNLGTLIILGLFLFAQAVGAFPFNEVGTQSISLPALINYQGRLNDAGGSPVPDGSYTMTFRLYSQASGGTPLWTEVRDVPVTNGLFNVMLGEVTALPSPFPSDPLYLGIKVGADAEMTPRERLGSVPFALVASVPDGAITTVKLADGAVTTAKLNVDNGLGVTGNLTVSGDVGIGTTNPGAKLHVQGTAPGTVLEALRLRNTDGALNQGVSLGFYGSGSELARIEEVNDVATGSSLRFYTFDNELVERVRITYSGNVGIGTMTPTERLHVIGNARIDGAIFSVGDVRIAPGGNERLRVTTSGNVGIGTTTPRARLHVIGTASIDGAISSVGDVRIAPGGNEKLRITTDGNVGILTTNPQNILTIQQNSATDPIADAWTSYSSRRWKTNIQPIEGALGKVQRLHGVSFAWKADGRHDIGLIAEEVGEVIPEVVTYEENGQDAKAVDYARLVAVLIEAMKEQQKEIEAQQATMDALIERITVLEDGGQR